MDRDQIRWQTNNFVIDSFDTFIDELHLGTELSLNYDRRFRQSIAAG